MTSASKSILVIVPQTPWPVRAHGVSIRYYPLLEHLATRHSVDLLVTNDPTGSDRPDPLAAKLRRVEFIPAPNGAPSRFAKAVTCLQAFSPFGAPFEYLRYDSSEVRARVMKLLETQRYDTVHWICAYDEMFGLRREFEKRGIRFTCDLIDSPYLYYVRSPKPNWLARNSSLFRSFDLWKARRWERNILNRAVQDSIFISPVDANAAGPNTDSHIIPNGIYADMPAAMDLSNGACIGFLGNMRYRPNIAGALDLHRNVFLPLKRELPQVTLKIIGRDPAPEIRALAGEGVEVTGTVSDIWAHIASVDVFVFPMTEGSGLQNKVLEAMYAGRPVVTTPICQASIGGRIGQDILVGCTDEEILAQTRSLLLDPARREHVAQSGRDFVREQFDLTKIIERFDRLLVQA